MGLLEAWRNRRGRRFASTLPSWQPQQDRGHVVQIYGGDFPVESVAHFVQQGIDAGEVALIVATPAHVKAMDAQLEGRGRVLYLDADETMAKFMVDGRPDRLRFLDSVGDIVQQAAEHGNGQVRAFGEMVVLLCLRGELAAAEELEALWNELAERHQLKLLCSYPIDSLAGLGRSKTATRLRDTHSHALAATA